MQQVSRSKFCKLSSVHKHIYATVITEGKPQLFEDKICNFFSMMLKLGILFLSIDLIKLARKLSVKKAGSESLWKVSLF